MSSHVVVIATDLRRANVKVNPSTYLTDVLEQACTKFGISSDKYGMKYKQKQLDLSHQFRTSGLVPGAKLELVQRSKTPSAVQVGLQLPPQDAKDIPGGRLVEKFPSTLTLWQVLRQFESGKGAGGRKRNLTARSVAQVAQARDGKPSGGGQLYYIMPVLNIMGREVSNFADYQKTLSQMGYNSGSVLLRLEFRISETTFHEAIGEQKRFARDAADEEQEAAEQAAVSVEAAKATAPAPATDADTTMSEAPAASTDSAELQTSAPINAPSHQEDLIDFAHEATEQEPTAQAAADPYQPAHVYLAPTAATPAATLAPVDESDFVPTVAHAQLHQAGLLEKTRNKRLLSDKELEDKAAAEAAKMAAVKSVLVKVRFPDQTSSDWTVGPAESGAFLYEAVRHVMATPEQPFHLVIPGEKKVIKDDSGKEHNLIRGYRFSGRVLVNLVWEDSVPVVVRKEPFLKSTVAQKGQAIKVPDMPRHVKEEATPSAGPEPQESKKEKSKEGVEKKLAKFLKLGKK